MELEKTGTETLAETVSVTNKNLYQNIYTILITLLTMPVSSRTAERASSVMERFKNFMRVNMTTQRFSDFALLHAYRYSDIEMAKVSQNICNQKGAQTSISIHTYYGGAMTSLILVVCLFVTHKVSCSSIKTFSF